MRERAREFGHYEVFEELGQGGIGVAYVARPTRGEHAGSYVCLKIMGREYQAARGDRRREAIDSLRHEARVVSQLHHPNIARLLDSGAFNDVWFLAFELIEGANLGEILALLPSGLAPELVRRVGIEVAGALQCAHEHDVLHRDIKPNNILISTEGHVKLVDFGLAKANARYAADFTVGVGTPRYRAPEQLREEALSAQTDIYALGVVLYESLAMIHPFDDSNPVELRKSVLRGAVRHDLRELGVPEDLASIIECCLQVDPAKRFQSAHALQVALRAGGKAAAFAYDMGEIAGAVREAVDESAIRSDKSEHFVEPGNNNKTVIADPRGQDTRHIPSRVLAETVRESLPRAVFEDVRDAVMRDLSVLAQEASRHHPSHTARRRQTTMMEAWPHPGQASPAGSSREPQLGDVATRSHTTVMEGFATDLPAAIAEPVLKPAMATRGNSRKRLTAAALVATLVAVAAITTTALRSEHRPLVRHQSVAQQEQRPAQEQQQKQEQPLSEPAQQPAEPPQPNLRVDLLPQSGPAANLMPPSAPAPDPHPPKAKASPRPRESIDPATRTANVAASARRTKVPARKVDAADLTEVTVGLIPYGEVLVDGKPAGQAPVVVRLSPGPHHIVGRYQQMRQARSIVVTPETQRVVLDLRNAESPQ